LFCHTRKCRSSCCEPACGAAGNGCCASEPSCGSAAGCCPSCGVAAPMGTTGNGDMKADDMPPAPVVDPSASVPGKLRVVRASQSKRVVYGKSRVR
jgi:hypothetical protein